MNPVKEFYKKQAETLLPNLKKRQFDARYFETMNDCKEYLFNTIEKDSAIAFGGSMTFEKESNLYQEFKEKEYRFIDRYDKEISQEGLNSKCINSDYFFLSANALSLNGEIVNIDGRGNRVSFLIYGPKNVILLVGMNKIEPDLDAAIKRARNIAAPRNAIRLQRNTPCTLKGHCLDCLSPDSICSNIVITRRSHTPNRIKVYLIGEELGF